MESRDREVRKIQITGKTTYIVSLPKKWVKDLGLTNGSLVTMIIQPNNSLLLLPDIVKSTKTEEVTLMIPNNKSGESLKRRIISTYLAGYNIIHIKSKDGMITPKQKDAIREVVKRNLVSTEIIADSSSVVTIQTLTTLPELSIKSVLRRMFLISSSMHRDVMSAMKDLNYELAKSIIDSDDEVDKFSLYVIRNLMLASYSERALRDIGLSKLSDILGYRVVVKSIERIADHATAIAEKCIEFKVKPDSKIMNKIEDMSSASLLMFEDSIEALLRRDYDLADNVAEKYEIVKGIEKEINEMLDANSGYYKLIIEDLRRVAEYAIDIGEVAINHTIDEILINR